MLVGLSPCPRHASGNVGDQLLVDVTMNLIEEVHGPQEFEVYFKREDFTSRLDHLNDADAIVLFGLEIDEKRTRPDQYRIAEDLATVEPPIVPIASKYSFFPGDERELRDQSFGPETGSFIDRIRQNCPDGEIPVRDAWVDRVLQRNGYDTVSTGDPAWYALDSLGEDFHRPGTVDQLVHTTPRCWQYVDQAKELLGQLAAEFPDADRIVSLHSAPRDLERELCEFARGEGWRVHYASHDPDNLALYRDTDLHVGYRYHGHLAHLRWRRPSIILEEDSRGRGLTESLPGAGVTAFEPRSPTGLDGVLRRAGDTTPVTWALALARKLGYTNVLPQYSSLKATPNPTAIDETMELVRRQQMSDWPMLSDIRATIDETYEDGMKPYLEAALD